MKICQQPTVRSLVSRSSALQLIATTAASWSLIAPVRARKRVRRIALRSAAVVRASGSEHRAWENHVSSS